MVESNDERAIDLAATHLDNLNGVPIGQRDYRLAVLVGLILAKQDGRPFTDDGILSAVEEAVRRFKAQSV